MDKNSFYNNITLLFQTLTIESLNDDNCEQVEKILLYFLNNFTEVPEALFYNFILLLKSKESSSFLIELYLKEIEIKLLRLQYIELINQELKQVNSCLPKFNNIDLIPKKGKCGIVKDRQFVGDKVIIKTYRVDDTGQALELLEEKELSNLSRDLEILNDSQISKLVEKNMKQTILTENDL